jgi:hypothetical protein
MTGMDPELFERMQEAAARFKSGESDFEEIITPAGPAHLVRDASDPRGFRIDFVGHGAQKSVAVQEYPASSSRPPGYPAPLPFLEGCAVVVSSLDQSATWADPPGGEETFDGLVRQMHEDGWTTVGRSGGEGAERTEVLDKEGAERTLRRTMEGGATRIVLQERPAASSEE